MDPKPKSGFTLVELLIVIALIAILAAIGLVIYREVSTRARDATRVADLNSIKNAIQITINDALDMADTLCFNLTPPCEESTYPKGPSTRNTDGTGWVKVNFDQENVANFNLLPLDPINDNNFNFTYRSDGDYWQIEANLESSEYTYLLKQDGGNNPNRYEVGSNIKNL